MKQWAYIIAAYPSSLLCVMKISVHIKNIHESRSYAFMHTKFESGLQTCGEFTLTSMK
jgi:hypothetical protein